MNRLSALLPLLAALALIGCRRSNSTEAHADSNPAHSGSAQRIVSVGSAVTETVYALGRGAQVVAVDTSSVYPEAATQLPQVGYQRALSAEGVLALSPSLVLLPPEAGPPGVLEQLKNSGTRIEIVDVAANEQGTFERPRRIAGLLGVDPAPLTQQIEHDLTAARTEAKARGTSPKVLVLYARGPGTVQAFGERTAAAQLLELASARNAAAGFEGSRPISAEAIVSWAPDFVLVPSRGLASLGGVDGVANLPGIAETPAGRERHIVGVDDVLLLAFGPRVGQAVTQVDRALRGLAIEQAPAPAYAPPSAVSGASSKAAAKP